MREMITLQLGNYLTQIDQIDLSFLNILIDSLNLLSSFIILSFAVSKLIEFFFSLSFYPCS